MKRLGPALLMAASLGCASATSAGPDPSIRWIDGDRAREEKDVHAKGQDPTTVRVCEWEEITGTRIRQKVCRNMATNEQDRSAAQKWLMDLQQQPSQKAQ